ncbi:N-acetyltransferase family protein [Paenibacillus macerans]|uniref:GNAT family N-acetyltransferase n=1 Tax=Paenibacillus macerans TaxID=44252 RepID=UPI003D31E961
MNLRLLQEADAEIYQNFRLLALRSSPEAFGSTYEREAAFSPESVANRLKAAEGKFVLGAFDDAGKLAGCVTFIRENGQKTLHKGNVFGMFVSPEMRGRGVGKALLRELVALAKGMDGVEQINLTVVSVNESARKLYESVGFQMYGTERRALKYNGQYFDEDLLVLRLINDPS